MMLEQKLLLLLIIVADFEIKGSGQDKDIRFKGQ